MKNITAFAKSSLCCAGVRPAGDTPEVWGTTRCRSVWGWGEQPLAAAGSAWPETPVVSDPKTRSIKPLCQPGVSSQNFVLGAAEASEGPIPLENRGNMKGYTFLSRGF